MQIFKISEYGYDEAVLGFSLSYNTSLERTKQILPKYAFGVPGENKFMESIIFYLDVAAPRFFWQEADTYRVGSTKQSESTMHTITKRLLNQSDFEYSIPEKMLNELNHLVMTFQVADKDDKKIVFQSIKNCLPEGFLQRRIWCMNYKTFSNIYNQRLNHRLTQWRTFCPEVLSLLDHPEFIVGGLQ